MSRTPPEDPWQDPEWLAYAAEARATLEPMIRGSQSCICPIPPEGTGVDPQFAMQLGYMIMLDKPIIVLVPPGTRVPLKLVKVADEIVEGDVHTPDLEDRIKEAVARVGGSFWKRRT